MDNELYFLKLLKWYINDEKGQADKGVNWAEILNLSRSHAVQAMVFMAVDKFDDKIPVYDEMKTDFFSAVNVAVMQDLSMEEVISLLNEAQIDHLIIKGYILRDYYPNREARSFGDVDFLIKEEDREKCHKALLDAGFSFDNIESNKYVWNYRKGLLSLEVHTKVVYKKIINDFDFIGYCENKFDRKNWINEDRHTYRLKDEDHFVYLLIHLAKHFYNAGVGVRMLIDFAVLYNKIGRELDFNYINNELKKIKLYEFSNIIFHFCNKYFGSDYKCSKTEVYEENIILGYILGHGVFGFNNKNLVEINVGKEGGRNLLAYFKTVFLDYESMRAKYIWFSNCKKYMLPYGWLRRIFILIFNKKKSEYLKYTLASLKGEKKDLNVHLEMLRLVGLRK